MDYNIIQAPSIVELIAEVNIWLTANPSHKAIGSPTGELGGKYFQAVGK
jgi:hypothetical protein